MDIQATGGHRPLDGLLPWSLQLGPILDLSPLSHHRHRRIYKPPHSCPQTVSVASYLQERIHGKWLARINCLLKTTQPNDFIKTHTSRSTFHWEKQLGSSSWRYELQMKQLKGRVSIMADSLPPTWWWWWWWTVLLRIKNHSQMNLMSKSQSPPSPWALTDLTGIKLTNQPQSWFMAIESLRVQW